jgi:hypothetical protein
MCRRQLERLRAEDGGGRVMALPLHPFAIGQPHRIRSLDRLMAMLRSHDGVWVARASDIVSHYVENYYDDDLALAQAVPGV